MSCGLDLMLLWCRPVATTLIRPLAWNLPYATGAAIKSKKQKAKKKKKKQNLGITCKDVHNTMCNNEEF